MVMIKPMFNGKLGVIRVVTSQLGFTRAFSIRVLIVRNVVPTVIKPISPTLAKSSTEIHHGHPQKGAYSTD